jgi:uncharacterized protein (TIGR03435 family)
MKKLAALILVAITPTLAQQPKFELADVHVSNTAYWFAQNTSGATRDAVLRDELYIYRDATMLGLIQAAYGVTEDAVTGGPSWLKSDLFDVVARVPAGTTLAAASQMLQPLLAERFALVLRREVHPVPRYVLSVGKGGSKLKRASGTGDSGCRQQMAGAPGGRGGDGGPASIPNMKVSCHNQTSQQIADDLKQMAGGYTTYLNHEVIDATKLEGVWDFDLEFTPSPLVPNKGPDAITIFDAVNKQLGLKLDLQDVPVPMLVVAGVNRKPTANPPEVAAALALAAPRFEVAAIKPADPKQPIFAGLRYTGGSEMRAGGTLHALIALAFQIQPNAANDKLAGLPKSADSQVWEITAKLPSTGEGAPNSIGGRPQAPPLSVGLEMLRGLLVDEFELKTHTENREATVYALTVGDGKPKLTKADPSERSDCLPDPNARKPFPGLGTMVNCKNITMAEFARNLEQATGFFDHPIVDATGLDGGWSFLLGFSRPRPPQAPNPDQAGGKIGAASDPDEYMPAYEAVEKQLGIKLVKQKRSIPVIVVDHVSEKPVE